MTLANGLLGQVATDAVRLNASGMAIMALSIVGVLGLLGFCLYRMLRGSHDRIALHFDCYHLTVCVNHLLCFRTVEQVKIG